MANKVLSADMLTSPSKVRDLVGAVQRSVILSNGWQLSTFAAQMSGLTAGGIDFYTIPTLGDARIGGADVLRVDPAAVASFVASLTTDDSGTPESSDSPVPSGTTTAAPPSGEGDRPALGTITVDVRNGSNTRGLAASVLKTLTDKGFQGGNTGDAPVRTSSVIQYAPGERTVAEFTAGELGGQFTYEEDGSLAAKHVTVVLGTTFQASGSTIGLRRQPPSTPPAAPSSTSSQDRPAPQINASGLNCVN
jgi:hypothetical protein